jgi:hypothetical protein
MSWILQNKFVAALIAGTLVMSGLLLYLGSNASGRYQQMLADFQVASADVSKFELLSLYPSRENLDGKTKALADYEQAIAELMGEFAKYQVEAPDRISPQEFGNRLVATNESISNRFRDANVALPANFYSGFENYTGSIAQSGATAILNHQLELVDALMSDLAAAKPTGINNFLRERLPEESGGVFEAKPEAIARPHSFELTFHGTEASARRFLTSLVDTTKSFAVIRTLRITNESTASPKSSSAQFATAAPAVVAPTSPFGGGFDAFFQDAPAEVQPVNDEDLDVDENPDAVEGGADDQADEPALLGPLVRPALPEPDGKRILGQVAGNELIRVFVRFDVMEFLPQPSSTTSDES